MEKCKYDFGGRLKAVFPSQIVVDLTERCNLACIHCGHESFVKSECYSGKDMDEAVHKEIVSQAAYAGTAHPGALVYIRYTAQGEPLLHPRVFEFLRDVSQRAGTRVSLTTNGLLMDPKAAEDLLASGIDIVDFSIDAFSEESYARIRRNGQYVRVVENVKELIRKRNKARSPLKIVTTFIEQPENIGESADFKKYWQDAGCDYVILRRLHSFGGFVGRIGRKLSLALGNGQRRPCLYPWERLSISPAGHISFCPSSWTNDTHFANIQDTSIADAWTGAFMRELREAHLNNDFSCCPACGRCPDWAQTRWPHEGASFADMVEKLCPCADQ